MGMNLFGSSSRATLGARASTDPDPQCFSIESIDLIGPFTLAIVHYPNCTTAEGNKVLVYLGDRRAEIRSAKRIDPHFTDEPLSPIARFAANYTGMSLARRMCRNT